MKKQLKRPKIILGVLVTLALLLVVTVPVLASQITVTKDVTITSAPNIYYLGDTIYYEMSVKNPSGNEKTNNLTRIWDTMPDDTVIEFLYGGSPYGAYLIQQPGNETFFYANYTVVVDDLEWLSGPGYWGVKNIFQAQGIDSAQDSVNGYTEKNSRIIRPAINISKTVDFDGDGVYTDLEINYEGETASWNITVCNSGFDPVYSINVTDTNGHDFGAPFDLDVGECETFLYDEVINADKVNNATAEGLDDLGNPVGPVSDPAAVEVLEYVDITVCKVEDVDGDPATDADRVPVEDWEVSLYYGNGTLIDTQTTGADGCYNWTSLLPGFNYTATETVPAGWFNWTATSYNFGVAESGDSLSYTFINSRYVDITVCKVEDVDANPATDADRVPVEGWTVSLYGDGVMMDDCIGQNTTGADGCYTWTGLMPGVNYTVMEIMSTGWFNWTPTSYNLGVAESGDSLSYTFINSRYVDVTVCKVEDVDGDPATDADRVPVEDWEVSLYGDDVLLDTQLTGADGCYNWTDLMPGVNYTATETVPAGWFNWTATSYNFGVAESGDSLSYTFINSRYVDITVCKVEDVDGDPATDADRVPVEGWEVSLYGDGVPLDTQLTGADGCYNWTDLMPGVNYTATETVPVGWFNWTATSYNFGVAQSGDSLSYTFINSRYVDITVCKVEDVDEDPATDADRVPVEGWEVSLYGDDVLIETQNTGADGCYNWTGLMPGINYTATETMQAGWYNWTATSYNFGVPQSGDSLSYTFINSQEEDVCWGDETAWAYGGSYAKENWDYANGNNWGWTNGPLSEDSYVFDVYAGAGQNDLSKGTLVGTVSVNYSGGCVDVTYNMDPGYYLDETHLWVGDDVLPEVGRGWRTRYTDAPGQFPYGVDYGFNSTDPGTWETEWSWSQCGFEGDIYVAAHAVVWMEVECEEEVGDSIEATVETESSDSGSSFWGRLSRWFSSWW